jgi:ribonuclease T2
MLLWSGVTPASEWNGRTAFDFYVLSLSWSPTYCLMEEPAAALQQCDGDQEHGFIVHGLWPQFERGWPQYCEHGPRSVPAELVNRMAPLMPSADLIRHQWRKHGRCSGLSPSAYFELVARARARIAIPPDLQKAKTLQTASPVEIEAAFRVANPGLPADGIAVTCKDGMLGEVRICLTRTLQFRSCREVDSRACRSRLLTVPAPAGN